MKIYDTANKLASEIKKSEEFRNYKKIKEVVANNPKAKEKIDEFEKIRYEVQVLALKGEEANEEKIKKLQELYEILIKDEETKEFFDLQVKFNVMISDINKIIGESIKELL